MPEARVSTSLKRQALVMTALGTPVMSAIVIAIPVLLARLWGTSSLDRTFWLGSAVMGVISLTTLLLIVRVSVRAWRTGEPGAGATLARWAPALMLVGGVAGAIIGGRIADNALDLRHRVHARACARVVDAGAVAACLPVMERCDIETRDGPGLALDRSGALAVDWPDGLEVPDSAIGRARLLCAWRALRGAGAR